MRVRPFFPALAVALAATAAVGPPASAAPGEGGGAAVPTGGGGGGAVYGQPAPEGEGAAKGDRKAKRQRAREAKRERQARRERRAKRDRGAAPGGEAPVATDPAGHGLPIAGPFDWGGSDARFGARRKGHRHQGQDLSAPLGTPVVATSAGMIEAVGYQARGAGHYVVLDGDGEDLDYVFMHLRRGSIGVKLGDRVALSQQLGQVGSSGRSTGAHLHFEIWVGGWYAGGHPIDPLPLLQEWSA